MSARTLLDTSIAISLFRYLYKEYSKLEQMLIHIYCNSRTSKWIRGFWEKLKICLRFSFLGRITEVRERTPTILDNSRAVQFLISFYKRGRQELTHYSRSSSLVDLVKDTKEELKFTPVRILSIIIFTAVVVNLFLSLALQRQIGLWGWLMRGLFLLAGASGLLCQADWSVVKRDSLFLRKMLDYRNG